MAKPKFTVVSRWDGPVDYAIGWKLDRLRRLIAESIEEKFTTTGRFAASFVVRMIDRFSIAISSDHPGAAAQEFGADIPERFPVRAQAMRFELGGEEIFARRARAFKLPAKHYIRDAVDAWVKHFLRVEWKGKT